MNPNQPPYGQPGWQYPPQGYPPAQGGPPGPQQPPYQQPPYQQPPYQQPPYQQPPYQQPPYQQPPYQQPPHQQYYGNQPPPGQPPYQNQPQNAGPYPGPQYPPPQQWPHPPLQGSAVQPSPPSWGYDPAQRQWYQPMNLQADVESLRKAMKGLGCDEELLIATIVNPKYRNPWAMEQLVKDYNAHFKRDLLKDVESETSSALKRGLLALLRGPLGSDADLLFNAIDGLGTDEDTLMDVLLCRSNADIRAISAEYKRTIGRDLLKDIRDDVKDSLHRLYSVVLSCTRAEDSAPVVPQEIDKKVTELQHATEGTSSSNALTVSQVLATANDAQVRALIEAYQRKYQRNFEQVIREKFSGDLKYAFLRILSNATERAFMDAQMLHEALDDTETRLIYRYTNLFWDPRRLEAAKDAYKKRFGKPIDTKLKERLSGSHKRLVRALVNCQ